MPWLASMIIIMVSGSACILVPGEWFGMWRASRRDKRGPWAALTVLQPLVTALPPHRARIELCLALIGQLRVARGAWEP